MNWDDADLFESTFDAFDAAGVKVWLQVEPASCDVPMLIDLLSGQVQISFDNLQSSMPHVRAGTLRALAVTTSTRSDVLPELPPVSDFVPGYEASTWNAVCAPKNTPAEIVDRLNRDINLGLADPRLKARLAEMGAWALPGSPADLAKLIADEIEKWGKVVRAGNIKAG